MQCSKTRAVVIGSLNLDEIFTVPHIAQEGETLSAVNYRVEGGGKGANQSVALAKAGCEVVHCGRIGRDGIWLTKHMEAVGVDVGSVQVGENEHTGRAIIQLSESTCDNSIVLFPGANHSVRLSDVKECVKRLGRKGDWMIFQNEVRLCSEKESWEQSELFGEVIEMAKSTGMLVALNPAPYTENLSSVYPLSKMDLLVLNAHEARSLALELSASSSSGTSRSSSDARSDLDILSSHLPSVRMIVVTLGSKGSICRFNNGNERGGIVGIPSAKLEGPIVDTTGAGDIFVGYLIAGLAQGGEEDWSKKLVETSLTEATKAAAIGCEKKGAMQSIPGREDVQRRSFV